MSRAKILEGFIQSEYESDFLPPFWQVIYNEGIRANHIIFDEGEINWIESELMAGKHPELPLDVTEALETAASEIYLSNDLGAIRSIVATLNLEQKKYLYLLYRRALSAWSTYIRNNLN